MWLGCVKSAFFMLAMGMGLSSCESMRSVPSSAPTGSYRLVQFNGSDASSRSFSLILHVNGAFSASFDCAEHFGTWSSGDKLTFSLGASAPRSCSDIDLRSGMPVNTAKSLGSAFFARPTYLWRKNNRRLILKSHNQTFVFESVGATAE